MGGFVYILGPSGSLQWTLLWGWEFLPSLQSPQIFTARGFETLFPHTGTLGCMVCLAPQLFLPVICMQMWDCPVLQPLTCYASSLPGCLSLLLLLVWMNVSSLTPWLSGFHTVWFSGSSGYFLFLNLLLSFFWLFKETKYIYLHLHLGQKSWREDSQCACSFAPCLSKSWVYPYRSKRLVPMASPSFVSEIFSQLTFPIIVSSWSCVEISLWMSAICPQKCMKIVQSFS